ncbi:MAG: hypothetical protein QM765_41740 [Myxococcales bacterium]
MRHGLLLSVLGFLLLVPASASAGSSSKVFAPGHHPHTGGAQAVKPSANVEELPGSLEMRVGQKRSFKVGGSAVCGDPGMARVSVTGKVMTVLALKEGQTKIFIFPGANAGAPKAGGLKSNKDINFKITR